MSKNQITSFFEEMQQRFHYVIKEFKPLGFALAALLITLKPKSTRQVCPKCGCAFTYIHEHKARTIRGGTLNGVPVIYKMDHLRHKCSQCGTTFFEKYDCLTPQRPTTIEAENYIIWHLGSMPMSLIAESIAVSEQTIANRAIEYAKSELEIMLKGRYRYLSMDEVYIGHTKDGKHRIYWVLNDITTPWKSNNIMLDIDRSKEKVIERLMRLENRDIVIAVCIDMWEQYKDAIEFALPKAAIVVDKFHVIQQAEKRMNNIRKQSKCSKKDKAAMKEDAVLFLKSFYKLDNSELERLEGYLKLDPQIEKMYFIFQDILEFFKMSDYDKALKYLCNWESRVIESGVQEALALYETIYNWLPYIMNYFSYRKTNGKTEGKNNLIRQIDRMGFHYGLTCLQGCLYAHDRKQEYVKWKRYQKKTERVKTKAKIKRAQNSQRQSIRIAA